MKKHFLMASLMVLLGFSTFTHAKSLCKNTVKMSVSEMAKHPAKLNKAALACLNKEWRHLSQKLTFRGANTASSIVNPEIDWYSINLIHYSPAAQYTANSATPIAFRTQPVINPNYVPRAIQFTKQTDTLIYSSLPRHLADEVPTANYQGSFANPIIYQTGHWNMNIDR